MVNVYPVGYSGAVYNRDQLLRWKHYTGMDPEFARRVLAAMDACAAEGGKPLGIGSTIRTVEGQTALFLRRHHEVEPGESGCCTWDGRRWALNDGAAHAAPPGRSYHEPSTPDGRCLAADMIGNLAWLGRNAQRFGLREFSDVNNEPWHIQPVEIPSARRSYRPAQHHPLPTWPLPQDQAPKPQRRTLRRRWPAMVGDDVRDVQRAVGAKPDGKFGPATKRAVMDFQRRHGLTVDGVVGPQMWGKIDEAAAA